MPFLSNIEWFLRSTLEASGVNEPVRWVRDGDTGWHITWRVMYYTYDKIVCWPRYWETIQWSTRTPFPGLWKAGKKTFAGISINKLSRDLSVPPNRIGEIVKGKRPITPDTAPRLQRYFRIEAQFWLNLQTEYDLGIMKRKIWSDIERRIIPAKETSVQSEYTAGT